MVVKATSAFYPPPHLHVQTSQSFQQIVGDVGRGFFLISWERSWLSTTPPTMPLTIMVVCVIITAMYLRQETFYSVSRRLALLICFTCIRFLSQQLTLSV